MQTVAGLFERYEDAERAVEALHGRGYGSDEISVAGREQALRQRAAGEAQVIAEGAGAGMLGGGALGALGGLLVGVGVLSIPGVGPLLAAGTLAAQLGATAMGAGIGAATGGVVGALVGAGLPREEARAYAAGIEQGNVLIVVSTDPDRIAGAQAALREAGAVQITAH